MRLLTFVCVVSLFAHEPSRAALTDSPQEGAKPSTRPAESAPLVLTLEFTRGWGNGLASRLKVGADGRFTYTERKVLRPGRLGDGLYEQQTWVGQLAAEECAALIKLATDAQTGPHAEDAGYVVCEWQNADGTRSKKEFTMPGSGDCKRLRDEAARLAKAHGAAGEAVEVTDPK